ncbi:ATP-binding protein [Mycoplasma sp. P36-A1]
MTFDKRPDILSQDEMITIPILDRIQHHSYTFNITRLSYRIKDN